MYYLQRIRAGRPVIVHGDGTSLWGSCHRDDVGLAFANTAGNRHSFGKSYHVTGAEWLTWNQYHQQVAAAMGAPEPQLVHIPTDTLYNALSVAGLFSSKRWICREGGNRGRWRCQREHH